GHPSGQVAGTECRRDARCVWPEVSAAIPRRGEGPVLAPAVT
ncbi:hypothetical protein F441_15836, partial [Phytophthora nicotianae CJ01A1]